MSVKIISIHASGLPGTHKYKQRFFSVVFVYSVAGNLPAWENISTQGETWRRGGGGSGKLKSRVRSAYCFQFDVNANIIYTFAMLDSWLFTNIFDFLNVASHTSSFLRHCCHHNTFHSCGQRNWTCREGHYWHPAAKGGRLASMTNCPLIILTLSESSW